MTGQTYAYNILLRNDSVSNWTSTGSTILYKGEIGIAFSGNTFQGMKIGDGTSTWNQLDYLYSGLTTNYYTKSEIDSNFLNTGTTIVDLSGYTQTYIDNNFAQTFTGFTGYLNLSGQTGEVVININNGIIISTGNTWI